MRNCFFLLAIFLLFVQFINVENKKNCIAQFKWMNGSWKMITKNGMIIESWKTINDSTMEGKSFFIKNNTDSTFLESIEMVARNNQCYYRPTANEQNENKAVAFKVSSFNQKGFVAENPEHDFPKRIIYLLINNDSIHAFIDGGSELPQKKSNFYYSRVKN